jgi:hypothetical protein
MTHATILGSLAILTAGVATVPRFETAVAEVKNDHVLVRFTEEFAGSEQTVTVQVSADAKATFPCSGKTERTAKVWTSGTYRADVHGTLRGGLKLSGDSIACGCSQKHSATKLRLLNLVIEDQTNGFDEPITSEILLSARRR